MTYTGSGTTTAEGSWDASYGPDGAASGPQVAPATFYARQDSSLSVAAGAGVLAGAVVPEGSTLSVELVSGPAHGSLTLNADGSFSYQPDAGWFGTDSFVVRISDGTLTSAPLTQAVEVAQVITEANNDFRAVATGDFDGDGNADFVAANHSTGQLYLYLGQGDGHFDQAVVFAIGSGALAAVAADLGNGALDVVVANSGDGTVSVLLNDGAGTFTTAQTLAAGVSPGALALGDFLGDGRKALAVADRADGTVRVFANDGSGDRPSLTKRKASARRSPTIGGPFVFDLRHRPT